MIAVKNAARHGVRLAIDIALGVDIVSLMATGAVEDVAHEWLGMVSFALLAAHLWVNRRWWRSLARGRYTARRVLATALDLLLVALMAALAISSVVLSRYAFSWLSALPGVSQARLVHLVGSAWLLMIAGCHAGMHLRFRAGTSSARRRAAALCLACAACYGLWNLYNLGVLQIMTLQARYAFVDADIPVVVSFIRYASIFALGMTAASLLSSLMSPRCAAKSKDGAKRPDTTYKKED